MLPVDGRLVDLEVAGVDDEPDRRPDGQRDAVGHAVRDADEFDFEGPDGDALFRPDRNQLVGAGQAMLEQLGFDQRERERRAVDGATDVRQNVRHSADVVFVAVRQHERGRALVLQVRQIGNDAIDAQQFGVGKHHARIDDDRCVGPGECQHVHAELAESAEGHHFEHLKTVRTTTTDAEANPGGTLRTR